MAQRPRGEPLECMYVIYDSVSSPLNGIHDDEYCILFLPKTYLGSGDVSRIVNDSRKYEDYPLRKALAGMSRYKSICVAYNLERASLQFRAFLACSRGEVVHR